MINVAVCGGSGYAGAELLRVLAGHSQVNVTAVTSEKSAGKQVTDLFPHLHGYGDLTFEPLDPGTLAPKAEIFFLSLPHATSQRPADLLLRKGKRVIDLSADHRLRDPALYEEWYKVTHEFAGNLRKAVYGLPELYRNKIRNAFLIANPGCYPTGAILGLSPALRHGIIDPDTIVIDSKSGTSGAGRQADVGFSFCEVNEGFKAYGLVRHRHTPEIEQELSGICRRPVTVTFTPHLVPLDRGILGTMYARLKKKTDGKKILELYRKAYLQEPFVRVLEEGKLPNVKHVRGTNYCEIGLAVNDRTNTLIVVTALDNLVKGAAGQAVQNMNILCGFEESTALTAPALFP